jgi:hypothetical protein
MTVDIISILMRCRPRALLACVVAAASWVACVGDDPEPLPSSPIVDGPDGGPEAGPSSDGATPDANGDGAVSPSPPALPPVSLVFRDGDTTKDNVSGTVVIGKAADESTIDTYNLYWGSDTGSAKTLIQKIPKTGANPTHALAATIPSGATHLLAFAANAVGETAASAIVGPVDNFPFHADVSAARASSIVNPSAVVDVTNKKLLVVSANGGSPYKPELVRCDLGGTNCAFVDISAGQTLNGGYEQSALIDAVSQKLLVVTENRNGVKPALFRCDLNGTSCAYTDLSAGQPDQCGRNPTALIDKVANKLLVVTLNANTGYKPALFRCDLNGASCAYVDISAGQTAIGGACTPSPVIDTLNQKLLVAVCDVDKKPLLLRCALDGTACATIDISAGQGMESGRSASVVIDAANQRLLVVTENGAPGQAKPSLFLCKLDGTTCSHVDLSAGQAAGSGSTPSAVIDAANGKLFVATKNGANSYKPSVFRCDLNGAKCGHVDVSAGQGTGSGDTPSAVIDVANQKLLVVTVNAANGSKPSLFTLGLW